MTRQQDQLRPLLRSVLPYLFYNMVELLNTGAELQSKLQTSGESLSKKVQDQVAAISVQMDGGF